MDSVLERINEIFVDVLDNEEIELTENSTANDIEEWDSLTNIQIVVAIEKQFKVKFTAQEIQSWNRVGDLISTLKSK